MMDTKRHGSGRAFFLVCLSAFLLAAICRAQDAASALAQARFYAEAELTRQALEVLEPLRANPQVRVEIARILFAAQDWEGAAGEYGVLSAEFPDQETVRRNLLISLYRAGRDAQAREILAAIGSRAEQNARTLTIRGLLAEREGRRADALADLNAAAALDVNDIFAPYELGLLLLAAGDAEAAVSALRETLRRDPASAQAHYNLGQALARIGRREEARGALSRAQELVNTANAARTERMRAVALAQRARIAAEKGAFEDALRDLDRALEILPGDPDLRALRESVAGAKGKP